MEHLFDFENYSDNEGRPAGGYVEGVGLRIDWQNGPLGRGEDRLEPNGAFVETVIAAAIERIAYYQDTGFACEENAQALHYLGLAREALAERTRRREEEGVEGTHEVEPIVGQARIDQARLA